MSDVADYTKISKIYLACLENNEYQKIPATPYVKGYISSYAACVGIDQHEALKLYDSFQNETNDAEELICGIQPDKKNAKPHFLWVNKKSGFVFAVGILIIFAVGLYYSLFQNQKEEFSRVKELSGSNNVPIHYENNIKIVEAAACSSVKDRTPQELGDSFEWSVDRIFIWTRIKCERLPSSIRHIYYFKGQFDH